MSRTGNRAQAARLRAREARLALMVERNAQDQRIEDAVAAVLLAWESRAAAAVQVEQAEGLVATGLVSLSREKVPVRDMAAMTGLDEALCVRLLKSPSTRKHSPDRGRGDRVTSVPQGEETPTSPPRGEPPSRVALALRGCRRDDGRGGSA